MLHRGCNDHQVTRRSVLSRAAADPFALPRDLLTGGGPAFLGEARSRREFLAGGVGAVLALGALGRLSPWQIVEQAVAAELANPDAPILVTLYLGGGNDGLNTLVPLSGIDAEVYRANRRRLAIDAATTLPVSGRADLGWHPDAAGLKALHDAGKLGAYLGVDYPNPSQSHFESVYFWRTAQLSDRGTTGWLGNYLDRYGVLDNPLQGVAINYGTDDLLRSKQAPTCAVFSPADFDFYSPDVWNTERMLAAWSELGSDARSLARRRAVEVGQQARYVRDALAPLRAEGDTLPPTPLPYPESSTGQGLRNIARMLGAGLGIRIATIEAEGGFDTHDDQNATHGKDLADVGDSLVAFQADLAARGLEDRVVTLVWSEFGRRVEDNDSNGTDHGSGAAVFVVSSRVNPTISDRWNLENLDAWDGNVPVAIDFRDLYAGVLEGHLQAAAADVIPAYAGTPLALLRPA